MHDAIRAIDGEEYRVADDVHTPPGWDSVAPAEARWLFERRDRGMTERLADACGLPRFHEWLPSFVFEHVRLLRRSRPRGALDGALPVVDLSDLAAPKEPEREVIEHFIEVRVLDDARMPCEGVSCRVTTPEGNTHERTTDQHGLCRVDEIGRAGACIIELPDLDLQSSGHATDALHEFVAWTVRVIDLRLHAWQWQSLASCPAQLSSSAVDAQSTDEAGDVTFTLRSVVPDVGAVMETKAVEHDYVVARKVEIAGLDPVELPRGQRTRLDNLGYVGLFDDDDDGPSAWAIEEFQCEHGLTIDGDCGPATRAKLLEVHGH
jgi:hypothetical protein